MQEAISEAKLAATKNEIPVGAVIANENKIISRAHNLTELNQDASCHAEILAIRDASRQINNWRLNKLILCVTLEPCAMCAGAIKLARISTVVYGAKDPRAGAIESTNKLLVDDKLGKAPEIISGILQHQCSSLLTNFFRALRAKKK